MMDWDDWTFKTSGWGTLNKEATEHDATNNPGAYYWDLGDGYPVNHILPEDFSNGSYSFEVSCPALPYHISHPVRVHDQRDPEVFLAQMKANRIRYEDGDADNFVVYEDDRMTALMTQNVKDKDGAAILLPDDVPAQEDPA